LLRRFAPRNDGFPVVMAPVRIPRLTPISEPRALSQGWVLSSRATSRNA